MTNTDEQIDDFTAALAAADIHWSRELGDPASEPAYIQALARVAWDLWAKPTLAAKDAEIERLTRELAEVRASREAWAIEAMGLEAQRDAATLALAEAHIRNGTLRAENRRRPHTVCISGSMQYETEMREVACRESVKGHIVVMPNCNLKEPHPLWDDPADAERIKAGLDGLHFAKIDLADKVIVVSDQTGYYGQSTANEIAYAEQLGKPVRHERVQLKTEAEPETCERHDASVKARGLDDTTGGA